MTPLAYIVTVTWTLLALPSMAMASTITVTGEMTIPGNQAFVVFPSSSSKIVPLDWWIQGGGFCEYVGHHDDKKIPNVEQWWCRVCLKTFSKKPK